MTVARTLRSMTDVVIVEAVRSPIGRRGGGLSTLHPAELLGAVQRACVERAGIDPALVDQVVGGCVTAVGEQAFNIARTAWLSAGLPLTVASTTIDAQCGSAQQAASMAAGLIASGAADIVVACGVEAMSRIPLGSSARGGPGSPMPGAYFRHYEATSQFEGAERIADKWGISRADTDRFGFRSQDLAAKAWETGAFEAEIATIEAPDLLDVAEDDPAFKDVTKRKPSGSTHTVSRDEGLRSTTLEKLATLKPVGRPDGVHTAGSSSQISDGAAAILLMSAEKASELGLTPRARIITSCLVGTDPVLMLTGPIDATAKVFGRTGLGMDDMDTIEINEAFASVALAWGKEYGLSDEQWAKVNPNGGAIALGHPVGSTGSRLITTALHTLERSGGRYGLITMCCGGGLGTGTIIERLG